MTAGLLPVIAAGAAGGAGIAVIIVALRPAPVRLDAALARLEATEPAARRDGDLGTAAAQWLAARLPRAAALAVPRADLALLGKTPEEFFVRKLAAGLAGLVSFALASAVLAVAGTPIPWEAPLGATLAAGAAMYVLPDADVRADAARKRRDWRWAWVSYLQLVRLARASGAATSEALESAAAMGSGWVFTRIQGALDEARAAHQPLWQGLETLGQQIGADEVGELADTIRVAGAEGTKIADTLAAVAGSMHRQLITDTRAKANSRTATMVVPLSLLGLGFILLLGFPAFHTLLTTGP